MKTIHLPDEEQSSQAVTLVAIRTVPVGKKVSEHVSEYIGAFLCPSLLARA